jgi:hypothetical protein
MAACYEQNCLPQQSVWAPQPVCIINTDLAAFKHFDLLIHILLWQNALPMLGSQSLVNFCPFHSFRSHKKNYYSTLLILSTNI